MRQIQKGNLILVNSIFLQKQGLQFHINSIKE
jgi:hypothetical protein